jgi:hypothetical protein
MSAANNETIEAAEKTKFTPVNINGPLRPEDISGPTPLTMYNSVGAAGINSGYAFSTVDASFGVGAGKQMIQRGGPRENMV